LSGRQEPEGANQAAELLRSAITSARIAMPPICRGCKEPLSASLVSAPRWSLSPWVSSARTLCCHSHGSVRPADLPRSCLSPPSAPWLPTADPLLSGFPPAPTLRPPLGRYPTSSRLPPTPAGAPSAATP